MIKTEVLIGSIPMLWLMSCAPDLPPDPVVPESIIEKEFNSEDMK